MAFLTCRDWKPQSTWHSAHSVKATCSKLVPSYGKQLGQGTWRCDNAMACHTKGRARQSFACHEPQLEWSSPAKLSLKCCQDTVHIIDRRYCWRTLWTMTVRSKRDKKWLEGFKNAFVKNQKGLPDESWMSFLVERISPYGRFHPKVLTCIARRPRTSSMPLGPHLELLEG